jgi:hypothetical protein
MCLQILAFGDLRVAAPGHTDMPKMRGEFLQPFVAHCRTCFAGTYNYVLCDKIDLSFVLSTLLCLTDRNGSEQLFMQTTETKFHLNPVNTFGDDTSGRTDVSCTARLCYVLGTCTA